MNNDALASACLFDGEMRVPGCPAAGRPGSIHGVGKQYGFVVGQVIAQVLVKRDACFPLVFIKFERNEFWLVIFEAKPVQQRDQA